jgi:hypothetical protein
VLGVGDLLGAVEGVWRLPWFIEQVSCGDRVNCGALVKHGAGGAPRGYLVVKRSPLRKERNFGAVGCYEGEVL